MKKVIVAMSGGVDSSMTAIILMEHGYEVIAAHFKMYDTDPETPPQNKVKPDYEYVKEIAERFKIPFLQVDIRSIFKDKIINKFISEYLSGRTPNPCVLCNEIIKMEFMLKLAGENNADYVSTGHYVRNIYDKNTDRYVLHRALYLPKDQSYYLSQLKQRHLSRLLTPLGEYSKEDIKIMAKKLNLPVAEKPESQEVCFIKDKDYRTYLTRHIPENSIKPGKIIFTDGKILGEHKGIPFYTIGQRKGLQISHHSPLYVIGFNNENNEVIVGEEKSTYFKTLYADTLNWIAFEKPEPYFSCEVQVRYRQKPVKAKIKIDEHNNAIVDFDELLRAPSPGQAVVFYDSDKCLGGGWINSVN